MLGLNKLALPGFVLATVGHRTLRTKESLSPQPQN